MVMPGAEEAGVGKGRRTGSLGQGFDRVQLVPPGSIYMTTHHGAGSEKQPMGPESQLWRVRPVSLASIPTVWLQTPSSSQGRSPESP